MDLEVDLEVDLEGDFKQDLVQVCIELKFNFFELDSEVGRLVYFFLMMVSIYMNE